MPRQLSPQGEVRQNLGCILLMTSLGGLGAIIGSLRNLPEVISWVQLVLGVGLIVVTVGIWNAREWSRRIAGVIACFMCINALGGVVQALTTDRQLFGIVVWLLIAGLMGLLAWYSFSTVSQRNFAEARHPLARARDRAQAS